MNKHGGFLDSLTARQ